MGYFKDVTEEVVKRGLELHELAKTDPEAREAIDEYYAECALRRSLKEALAEKNLSQEEIEKRTGMPKQTIKRIETDFDKSPDLKNLMRYASALGYHLTLVKNQPYY